ncbi:MAG TPA: DUF6789 family protein [Polyangia bacterium]|jgi:hypothetical protein|nr:DUF6789 family protein [Polyangia bacterium]
MTEIRMQTETTARRRAIAVGGIVAGLIGGAVIAALMMVIAAGRGDSVWRVLKMASSPFFHQRAMTGGFDAAPIAAGVLIHFAVSIIWGVLFAVVAYGISRSATVGVGALWGVAVWLVMFFIVVPLVSSHPMRMTNMALPLVEHIIFGLAVGVGFLPYQHEQAARRPWWRFRRVQ